MFSTDGHHKLIRWRFGCIDGYSRMITFLHCSTNNKADTVHRLFVEAAYKYGYVVTMGVKTLEWLHIMVDCIGTVSGSTHNQRIERLWGDVHRSVTKVYYRLFHFLEHHGLLDPLNEVRLLALHSVYLPRIQGLEIFVQAWNNHGLRTTHNSSPNQLFVFGCLRLRHSGLVALDFFDSTNGMYGVNESDLDLIEDLSSLDDEQATTAVEVPSSKLQLSPEKMELLNTPLLNTPFHSAITMVLTNTNELCHL